MNIFFFTQSSIKSKGKLHPNLIKSKGKLHLSLIKSRGKSRQETDDSSKAVLEQDEGSACCKLMRLSIFVITGSFQWVVFIQSMQSKLRGNQMLQSICADYRITGLSIYRSRIKPYVLPAYHWINTQNSTALIARYTTFQRSEKLASFSNRIYRRKVFRYHLCSGQEREEKEQGINKGKQRDRKHRRDEGCGGCLGEENHD